ncbi:MAG: cyclic nucleotide-binding domain-containing protein [Burkholderiales bacterium]|nr:cyclic nucleotide-binding domain-containing protein [Burkholderiales bacterium]
MDRAGHIAVFLEQEGSAPRADDVLRLPGWTVSDWDNLLRRTRTLPVRASEVVIQRGAMDRTISFVAAGLFEVGITQVDGVSISPLARIGPGSVIGEQSFFDGLPRSANVWAVAGGELLALDFDDFARFGRDEPALARDLLFALGRVLSSRLRNTTFRVRR